MRVATSACIHSSLTARERVLERVYSLADIVLVQLHNIGLVALAGEGRILNAAHRMLDVAAAGRVRGPRGCALTCGAACGARQSELLSDEKLAEFNEAFDLFDKKKEGKIPSQDLIVVFQAMKLNLSKREEQEYLAVPTRHARVVRTSAAAALRPHGQPAARTARCAHRDVALDHRRSTLTVKGPCQSTTPSR